MSCKIDGMCKSAAACFLGGCIYDEKPVTENNVEAQAGDEPMRAAFEAAHARINNSTSGGGWNDFIDGRYDEVDVHDAWILWQEAYAAGITEGRAYQRKVETKKASRRVSPRATTDVERDADDEASRGSMEDFSAAADLVDAINACKTKGEALGLVLMYRKAIRLATTKPGA